MEQETIINDDNIARVHDLLACMQNGDEEGAREIVDDLARVRESALYQEMGKLTRELHDAISAFGMDDRITDITANEIPDARQRLNYVISKTDDAANRTLTAVEASLPVCEQIEKQASELHSEWERFTQREMNADDFRSLCKQMADHWQGNINNVAMLKQYLNEVLLAQDFQDLTGQIIKRVITLVEEVEANLVNLIKVTGMKKTDISKSDKEEHTAFGPVVPGVDDVNADTVSGQDEVDDLLSSLGF